MFVTISAATRERYSRRLCAFFVHVGIRGPRNVGRGTEGLSKEKEKEVTSFELINYLQNEDIQKSLGAMREQDLTIEKLA